MSAVQSMHCLIRDFLALPLMTELSEPEDNHDDGTVTLRT